MEDKGCFTVVLYITYEDFKTYFCVFISNSSSSLFLQKNYNNLSIKKNTWFRCKIYQKNKNKISVFKSLFIKKLSNNLLVENVYEIDTDTFLKKIKEVINEYNYIIKQTGSKP